MIEYPLHDIILHPDASKGFFVGRFENIEDPPVEWPHRHAFYSIVWFTEGLGINVIDFSECEILPNRLFTVNPKQVHNWSYSENCQGYVLVFEEFIGKQLNIQFSTPYVDVIDQEIAFFEAVFEKLMAESERDDYLTLKNSHAGITYLFALISRLASSSKAMPHPVLTGFRNLVCSDFSRVLTIEDCARSLKISTQELNAFCRHNLGVSAKQYQLDLKITEAKRLLIYTTYPTSEVAHCTGFEDTSYFARIFKKKTGASPTHFKEKYRDHGQKS